MSGSSRIVEKYGEGAFGIERGLQALGLCLAACFVLCLLLAILGGGAFAVLLFFISIVCTIAAFILLLSAKGRVLKEKEILLFGGLTKLVSWDPGEGVVFLKNKGIEHVKGTLDNAGGIRLIFPVLGEELALRIPLQVQTLSVEGNNPSTKDNIPLDVQSTIFWKLIHLERFYLSVGSDLKLSSNRHAASTRIYSSQAKQGTVEYWLASLVKEKSRSIFSRIDAGQLIVGNLAAHSRAEASDGVATAPLGLSNSDEFLGGVDRLSQDILAALSETLVDYGMAINRVTIEEIKLPPEIYRAAAEAAASRYSEVSAASAANSRKKMLQAEVEVLGVESVAFKEIAAHMSGPAVQDILMEIIGSFHRGKIGKDNAGQGDIPSLGHDG